MTRMRSWDGIRDDTTDVGGDDLKYAVGTSFAIESELRRRSGLTALTAHGGISLAHFTGAENGSWLIVFKSTGDIEAVAL